MQVSSLTYGLLGALAIALLVAAITDWRRRQIDNWLNAAIALAAPLFWWASGMSFGDIGWQIGLCLLTFGITSLIFAIGWMGGGDVKLLAALALWVAPLDFMRLLMIMALIGGAMSVGVAAVKMTRSKGDGWSAGFAYLCTALWMLLSGYALFLMGGGTPVSIPIGDFGPVLPFIVMMVLVLMIAIGVLPMLRRQPKKYPVPYGLAISAAGLWLLVSNNLHHIQFGFLPG